MSYVRPQPQHQAYIATRELQPLEVISLPPAQLEYMLQSAAKLGAELAITDMVTYHFNDACKKLNVSPNTLRKRIAEGKIKQIDGRITGAEIRRYLQLNNSRPHMQS